MNRLKRFLQSVPSRIVGSHVETKSEHVTRLAPRIKLPVDEQLAARISAARQSLPVNNVKPLRAAK